MRLLIAAAMTLKKTQMAVKLVKVTAVGEDPLTGMWHDSTIEPQCERRGRLQSTRAQTAISQTRACNSNAAQLPQQHPCCLRTMALRLGHRGGVAIVRSNCVPALPRRSSHTRHSGPGHAPRAPTPPHALPPQAASAAVVMTLNIGELFQGIGSLMPGEVAAVFSAIVALGSVSLNLWGGILSERKRADLQKEFMRERLLIEQNSELRSIVARYRGPLLEATVDLEQRVYHLITGTGEWGGDATVCEEELIYTLFTMAQFLGFVEVVRREGPRERSFLQQGNPQGTDTLNCLVEGFRFALAAHADALEAWNDEAGTAIRDHPGSRRRNDMPARAASRRARHLAQARAARRNAPVQQLSSGQSQPGTNSSSSGNGVYSGVGTSAAPGEDISSSRAQQALEFAAEFDSQRKVVSPDGLTRRWTPLPSMTCIAAASGVFDSWEEDGVPGLRPATETFRVSRGCQRAIGSMMIVTPVGASRHYTQSYGDFYARFRSDPYFAGWLKPLYEDMLALVSTSSCWDGRPAFPINRWTRLLLLQQLLVDTIDLLDPAYVRVPENRRVRLAPIEYAELPHYEEYRKKLESMETAYQLGFGSTQTNAIEQASAAMGTFFKYVGVAATGVDTTGAGTQASISSSSTGSTSASSSQTGSQPMAPTHVVNGSDHADDKDEDDSDWRGGGGDGGGGRGRPVSDGSGGGECGGLAMVPERRRQPARQRQRVSAYAGGNAGAGAWQGTGDLWPAPQQTSWVPTMQPGGSSNGARAVLQPGSMAATQGAWAQSPVAPTPPPTAGATQFIGSAQPTQRQQQPGSYSVQVGGPDDTAAAQAWQSQRGSPGPGAWIPAAMSFPYPTDTTGGLVSQGISPEVLGSSSMVSRVQGVEDLNSTSTHRADRGARAAMKALDDIIERNWDAPGPRERHH